MKKVFLEELPKKKWNGTLCIDWINSVGYTIEFIYEDIHGEIEIVDYIKKKQKLVIKYKNKINEISTSVFSKCSIGKIIGKITKDFKININSIIKDSNRDMIILNREYRKEEKIDKEGRKSIYNLKWYQYKCNICGWDKGWIREDHLLKGVGCSCCRGLTVVKSINDIATTNPEIATEWHPNRNGDLLPTMVSSGSHKKVWWKCKYGHEWQSTVEKRKAGTGCPICKKTKIKR